MGVHVAPRWHYTEAIPALISGYQPIRPTWMHHLNRHLLGAGRIPMCATAAAARCCRCLKPPAPPATCTRKVHATPRPLYGNSNPPSPRCRSPFHSRRPALQRRTAPPPRRRPCAFECSLCRWQTHPAVLVDAQRALGCCGNAPSSYFGSQCHLPSWTAMRLRLKLCGGGLDLGLG